MSWIRTFRKNETDVFKFIRTLILEQVNKCETVKIWYIPIIDRSNLELGNMFEITKEDIDWNMGIILIRSDDWHILDFYETEMDLDGGMLTIDEDECLEELSYVYLYSCPDDFNMLFQLEQQYGGCHYDIKNKLREKLSKLESKK